jgi:hypothetical protein
VSIDYSRRGPKPAPRRTQPVPTPAPTRKPFPIGYVAARGVTVVLAAYALTHRNGTFGMVLLVIAALSWWRIRQAIRYLLAVAGMTLIRWWVVRKTRPYADQLEAPGRVTDPNAPWRQWLDTRCGECGV